MELLSTIVKWVWKLEYLISDNTIETSGCIEIRNRSSVNMLELRIVGLKFLMCSMTIIDSSFPTSVNLKSNFLVSITWIQKLSQLLWLANNSFLLLNICNSFNWVINLISGAPMSVYKGITFHDCPLIKLAEWQGWCCDKQSSLHHECK